MKQRANRRPASLPIIIQIVVAAIILGILTFGPAAFSRVGTARNWTGDKSSSNPRGTNKRASQANRIAEPGRVTESGIRQIAALLADKESRTPTQQKIDSQLLQAVRESRGQRMVVGLDLAPADVNADTAGNLTVDISATVTDDLLAKISSLGGKIIYPSAQFKAIRAQVNLSSIETVAAFPEVTFIQPAVKAYTNRIPGHPSGRMYTAGSKIVDGSSFAPNGRSGYRTSFAERAENVRRQLLSHFGGLNAGMPYFTGTVNSEGDRTHRADDVRSTFGYAGEGVRIGVISDSFNANGGVPNLISSGNLPGPGNPFGHTIPVTVVQDDQSQGDADEGAALLEIVHDIAPNAQLFFATANVSEASFAENILALRNAPNNCDIIIDDVQYFDEPPFQDGIAAQAVNTVTANGALYFSAAGNNGSLAKGTSGVWEGDFSDTGSTLTIPGNGKTGTVLNFGTRSFPSEGDTITGFGNAFTLSWADPQGSSSDDYDLFIMDSSLTTVRASSTNIQNGTQNPFEAITSGTIHLGDKLVVFKSASAAVRAISLNTQGGTLSVATAGQTFGHSASSNAFSLAATPAAEGFDFSSPLGPFPNPFTNSNTVEKFSSDGPRRVFFNADGSPLTPGNLLFGSNGGVARNKPDITAADGVSVAPIGFIQSPFFGTSAAAPHAAAIAALLKSANPSLSPQQIRNILTSTALDIETPGFDKNSGFGIVQAFQAMQQIQPSPTVSLTMGTVTASEGDFSNHNGAIEPGETVNLVITLNNPSGAVANNVKATLFGTGANATSPVSYGTIPAFGSSTNTSTPLKVGIPTFVGCGSQVQLFLIVSFDGGASPQQFPVTVNTGGQLAPISSTLGNPASGTGFTAITGTQTGIIKRNGSATSCPGTFTNPGLADSTGLRAFDAYTFINRGPDQCITVTLNSPNGANLYVTAYNLFGYDPTEPAGGELVGAAGSSGTQQSFSFKAVGGQRFFVVVHEVTPGGAVGSPYTLAVSPLTVCATAPACNQFSVSPASLPAAALGVPYAPQKFTVTGGSGLNTVSLRPLFALSLPGGMVISGDTLSGTPTQAGEFIIGADILDPICQGNTVSRELDISGDLPASIAVLSGYGQSTPPGTTFPLPLKVIVRDKANKPLPGVAVFFDPSTNNFSSTPSGTFAGGNLYITDANGIATSSSFKANSVVGTYFFSALVSNGFGNIGAVFNLNNSCAPVVTNNADSGPGSLRDAVTNACDHSTITFAPNVTGTIALTSGEIVISKNITIQGPGANVLSISGSHRSRVFTANANFFEGTGSTISGLTIRDGAPSSSDTSGGGGGVLLLNLARLTLVDSVVSGNDVSNSAVPSGGGIEAATSATLTLTRCAVINNTAGLNGGGIHLISSGTIIISNTTIAGNKTGPSGKGGGIELEIAPDSRGFSAGITDSTIFGNSANVGGNIANFSGGSIQCGFGNSIVAGGILIGTSALGPDLNGSVFGSGQNNIIQDTSSATFFPGFGDIIGASPLLLPLGNYGGPTPSMPPQPNSPAINAGAQAVLADLDQRGFLRRPTGSSDIGSVGTDYSFSLIGGTPQSANATKPFASPLQAKVTESGVPISGATVTFTAPSSGASALFGGSNTATVITDSNGLATSPTVIANGFAGSYTVTASIGSSFPAVSYDLTNIQVVSNIVASAGSPQHTALSAQFPVALQATVLDSNNGPVQGINVTFSAPTTGASGKFAGSVTSVTVATNSNGVATAPAFTANNIVGSYSVTASVDGNVQPGSFSLTNLPPTVSVKTGSPQSTAPGANFLIPLQALVLDGNGNPLSNVSVLFTAPSNGASGTFNGNGLSVSINTDSSGVATAPLFVANNSIGSYTVTASIAGNPTPASFSLNNVTPGQPATVTATQGQGQKAGLNIDYGPLQVTVADASGIPVGGITVTFQVDPGGSGATGSFTGNQNAATAITDVNGRATAPTLTANNIIGSFDVTASTSVQGSSSADFNLANIVVVSGDLSGDGQVTVQDLVILANIIAGNITSTPTQKVCGDVFQDNTGQITIQDLVTLANFIAGNIHSLPVVSGPIVNPAEKRGY